MSQDGDNDDLKYIKQDEAYRRIAAYKYYVRDQKILTKDGKDSNLRQVTFYQESEINQVTGAMRISKIDEIFYYICTQQTYN